MYIRFFLYRAAKHPGTALPRGFELVKDYAKVKRNKTCQNRKFIYFTLMYNKYIKFHTPKIMVKHLLLYKNVRIYKEVSETVFREKFSLGRALVFLGHSIFDVHVPPDSTGYSKDSPQLRQTSRR